MNSKKIMFLLVGLHVVIMTGMSKAQITDVYILPDTPNTTSDITIYVSGLEVYGPVDIYDTDFQIDGTLLELDLFLNVGPFAVITPWSYDENIVTLSQGTYDLTVNTFEMSILDDSYSIQFEVIPEPASLLILTTGSLWVFRYSRKRKNL